MFWVNIVYCIWVFGVSNRTYFFFVITFLSLARILPCLLVCNNHSVPFPVSSSTGDRYLLGHNHLYCLWNQVRSYYCDKSDAFSVLGFWLHLFGFRNGFLPQCSLRVNPTIQDLRLRHMFCIVQLFARALGHWYSFTIN